MIDATDDRAVLAVGRVALGLQSAAQAADWSGQPEASLRAFEPVNAVGRDSVLLSVVIAALDEEESLPKLWDRLRPVLDAVAGGSAEVIVADDGSGDATWMSSVVWLPRTRECVGFGSRETSVSRPRSLRGCSPHAAMQSS